MKYVSRTAWGSRRPTNGHDRIDSNDGVKLHWLGTMFEATAHEHCDDHVRGTQRYHMDTNGWADIAYNFVVCPHGYVYEGRGFHAQNAANGNTSLNRAHYAVCLMLGSSGHTQPSDDQVAGVRDIVAALRRRGAGDQIRGHRDGHPTACPGDVVAKMIDDGRFEPVATVRTHVVAKGDTLSAIARRYEVTADAIAAANDLDDPDRIYVGQKLTIPAKSADNPQVKRAPRRPTVDLSRLVSAAKSDPAAKGQPVRYSGVRTVEKALVAEGLLDRDLADGHYGTATVRAYSAWQRSLGYRGSAADGIPGRTSLTELGRRHGFTVRS